jgi:hypothetical protein
MNKKIIIIMSSLLFLLNGCTTKLLEEKHEKIISTKFYQDKINSFLITENKEKIIFISDKYHYVLNLDENLKILIENKNELVPEYNINERTFDLNSNTNEISVGFRGKIKDITAKNSKLINQLKLGEFEIEKNNMFVVIRMKGQRFLSNEKINKQITKIEKPILININENDIEFNNNILAKKILLSPLTLAADGTMIIGGTAVAIGVAAIVIPFKFPYDLYNDLKNIK